MQSIVGFLVVLVLSFSTNASFASDYLVESKENTCDSIAITGANSAEEQSFCAAFDYLVQNLKQLGMEYKVDRPLKAVLFSNTLIYNPDEDYFDLGYYDFGNYKLSVVNEQTFLETYSNSYSLTRESYEAFLVHELMRHFMYVNGNNSALSFFLEIGYSYMQIEYRGIDNSMIDFAMPTTVELCGYELSDLLYANDPIFYSFVAWYWLKEDPKAKIQEVLTGDINLQYIYDVVKRDCPAE